MFDLFAFAQANEPQLLAAIPEPSTYALMLAGLGMVALIARRRRKFPSP